ncbi:type II toxin-antitoxin system death-on-curing family toxin [Candidatus Daviesbacteria bacterium]|nr:type II toxin-antitoxin system death-on-curing family toxin [Candidatus Daviesbacteria bacterium]
MTKIVYLTLDEVLAIHYEEVERFGGSHGVRSLDLLDSALHRPQASFMGEDLYPSLFHKAAALMHSILLNHPFIDANKRTSTVSMAYFLHLNGYNIKIGQEELVEFALKVESKQLNLEQISKWLKDHSVKI